MTGRPSLKNQNGLSSLRVYFHTARALKLLGTMMLAVLFHCAYRPLFFGDLATDEMYFRLLIVFSAGAVVLGLMHSLQQPRCWRMLRTEKEFRLCLVIYAVVFSVFVTVDLLALTHVANNSAVPVFRIVVSAIILLAGGAAAERRCKARGAR